MDQDKKNQTGAPSSDTTSALFVSARKKQLEQQEADRRAREKEEQRRAAEDEVRRLEREVEERKRRAEQESRRVEQEAADKKRQAAEEARKAEEEVRLQKIMADSRPAQTPAPPTANIPQTPKAATPPAPVKMAGASTSGNKKLPIIIGAAAGAVVIVVIILVLVLGGGGSSSADDYQDDTGIVQDDSGSVDNGGGNDAQAPAGYQWNESQGLKVLVPDGWSAMDMTGAKNTSRNPVQLTSTSGSLMLIYNYSQDYQQYSSSGTDFDAFVAKFVDQVLADMELSDEEPGDVTWNDYDQYGDGSADQGVAFTIQGVPCHAAVKVYSDNTAYAVFIMGVNNQPDVENFNYVMENIIVTD